MTYTVSIKVQTMNGFRLMPFYFETSAAAVAAKTKGIWVERLEQNSKHIMLCFYLTTGPVSKRGKCSFLPFINLHPQTHRINVEDRYNFQLSAFRIHEAIA